MRINLIVILFFSIIFPGIGYGQSFSYELTGDPVDITGWFMGGDAIVDGDAIRITEAVTDQNGHIYYGEPQILSGDCAYFTIDFEYMMEPSASPADGFAFWFLEDPPSGFVSGEGIGMPTVMDGFALVFDTYNNTGIDDMPTISIRKFETEGYIEDDMTDVIGTILTEQDYVYDGTWRHCLIEYSDGIINVYLDYSATPNITGPLDLTGILGYFGFSASTGAAFETHYIRNVYIEGVSSPNAPVVEEPERIYCQFDDIPSLNVDEALEGAILHWYDVPTGGTELSGTPVVDGTIADTFRYYVSQSVEGCPIQSPRTEIVVIVRPKPEVNITPDNISICYGGEIELNANLNYPPDAGFVMLWSPPEGLTTTTTPTTIASPETSATYVFNVNTGAEGCSAADTVTVNVIPNDINVLNNDTVLCSGSVLPVNATYYPGFYYAWTPEASIADPHSSNTAITATESSWVVLIASHMGCPDVRDSFYMEVQPIPTLNLGADRVICMGDTVQFYASTTPAYDDYIYEWSPGLKLTDSTIKNPVFNGYSSETYYVDVSTPWGCADRDTVIVTVHRNDFLSVNFNDTIICGPQLLQLEADGADRYEWYPSEGLSEDSIRNPIYDFGNSMTYTLVGYSDEGCVDTQVVYIDVASRATVDLPDSVMLYPGESYQMDITSNAHYFNWYPPEGLNFTDIPNPITMPQVRTRYFVTASTENECSIVDSIDIIVHLESLFDIPNAFVPGNQFSNNGTFKIISRGDVKLNQFRIYNRWGGVVFETNNVNEGWDGTFDGKPQPAGVYVYVVEAALNSGRVIHKEGNVTLIR